MPDSPKAQNVEAARLAVRKYHLKLDEIKVRAQKGFKAEVQAAAELAGQSMNEYCLDAIRQRMSNHQK